jgi:hypothetical protein
MRRINQVLGIVTMVIGFVIASAGPEVFLAVIGGTTLPKPVADNPAAMTIWAGVAFARAFGAALLVLGAVLWAANRAQQNVSNSDSVACFCAAAFATFVVWAQQNAIWTTNVGFIFVALIAVIAISSGAGLVRSLRTRS